MPGGLLQLHVGECDTRFQCNFLSNCAGGSGCRFFHPAVAVANCSGRAVPCPSQAVEHFRREHPEEFAQQDQLAAADNGTVFRVAFQRRSNGMRMIRNLPQVLEVRGARDGGGGACGAGVRPGREVAPVAVDIQRGWFGS